MTPLVTLAVPAYALWRRRAALLPQLRPYAARGLLGAAIGALLFKERFGGPRIAAAALMAVGIGLMLHAG